MNEITKVVVFIVGLGAPASLYTDYLADFKKHFPQSTLLVLDWWNQSDYGISQLQSYLGNEEAILVCHSAGGVIALQALAKWPDQIKKIIFLDSHFLRTQNALPTVSRMLDIMLSHDDATLADKVRTAYSSLLKNDSTFNGALKYAINWVNNTLDQARESLTAMPIHSILLIGFTTSAYQMLTAEDEKSLLSCWEKFNIDIKCLPMNHFDLIDEKYATTINQLITDWLHVVK